MYKISICNLIHQNHRFFCTDCLYLFRERTVISLGYMFSHTFSHRLDFFAQGNTRCWWRLNGISQTISIFILNKNTWKKKQVNKFTHWFIVCEFKKNALHTVFSLSEMATCAERLARSNPPKLHALCEKNNTKPGIHEEGYRDDVISAFFVEFSAHPDTSGGTAPWAPVATASSYNLNWKCSILSSWRGSDYHSARAQDEKI